MDVGPSGMPIWLKKTSESFRHSAAQYGHERLDFRYGSCLLGGAGAILGILGLAPPDDGSRIFERAHSRLSFFSVDSSASIAFAVGYAGRAVLPFNSRERQSVRGLLFRFRGTRA